MSPSYAHLLSANGALACVAAVLAVACSVPEYNVSNISDSGGFTAYLSGGSPTGTTGGFREGGGTSALGTAGGTTGAGGTNYSAGDRTDDSGGTVGTGGAAGTVGTGGTTNTCLLYTSPSP